MENKEAKTEALIYISHKNVLDYKMLYFIDVHVFLCAGEGHTQCHVQSARPGQCTVPSSDQTDRRSGQTCILAYYQNFSYYWDFF